MSGAVPTKMIISCPIPAYSAIADAGVLLRLTPGFAGPAQPDGLDEVAPAHAAAAAGTTLTSRLIRLCHLPCLPKCRACLRAFSL